MKERRIHTCFGEFIVKGAIAYSVMDCDLFYHLPTPDMDDDEINEYFRLLEEMEE